MDGDSGDEGNYELTCVRSDESDVSEREICSSKMKPGLRAEWALSSEQELILASYCLSPMRRNSVFRRVKS